MRSYKAAAAVMSCATPFIRFRPNERLIVAVFATVFSVLGILFVHPTSLAHFGVYLVVWCTFIHLFHRDLTKDFIFAFFINSAFITAFYLIQTSVYPDSYGTTSPLSSSWTDDSYFFALAADDLPPNLVVRDNYFLYEHPYPALVRALTPFSINHPMDVIFFQSGISAMLATFTKKYLFQLSANWRLADTAYLFVLVCPFLMMNGGVLFIRDTFTAALFIYSLSCISAGRIMLAVGALTLQTAIRPGTAIILIPAYAIIYWDEIFVLLKSNLAQIVALPVIAVFSIYGLIEFEFLKDKLFAGITESGGFTLLGRNLITDLMIDPERNVIFSAIQELPYFIKLLFNGAYTFTYPFLSLKYAFEGDNFDIRAVIMNGIAPVHALWLNAWFIAGTLTRKPIVRKQRKIVIAIIVILLLLGTYSMQTRHKTIIYPLYYFIAVIGFVAAKPAHRTIGYLCSSALLLPQLLIMLR